MSLRGTFMAGCLVAFLAWPAVAANKLEDAAQAAAEFGLELIDDGYDIVEEPFPLKQAAVARAVHGVFDATERGDVDRLESFHLFGPKFSKFDDVPASARQDAAAARMKERMALSALKAFKATVEDLKVDVLGSVAVATFILRYSFETADASGSSSARSTIVLVEAAGSWKILHEHFSRLEVAR